MNFVQQLEESLRDLAAEARKRHPGVEEASERATRTLRQYQNAYVSAVRQANATHSSSTRSNLSQPAAAPTTKLFQSSELLHPFLLAANYPNASPKLLEISFRAMRLLLEADAVVPSDSIHLIRVWMIQAQVVAAYYQKHYHHKLPNSHHRNAPGNPSGHSPQATSFMESSTNSNGDETLQSDEFSQEVMTANDKQANQIATSTSSSSSGSSWFFWSSSSSAASAAATNNSSTETTLTATTSSPLSGAHVVSSSSGKTGHSSSLASVKDMEKLALDILSSLLQLMQGMHRNYPESLVGDTILWKHAFGVVCLCLSPSMNNPSGSGGSKKKPTTSGGAGGPISSVIQQAAHSTLSQMLSLLYEPIQESAVSNDDSEHVDANSDLIALQEATWQDLLLLSQSGTFSYSSPPHSVSSMLRGAFSLCRTTSAAISAASTSLSKKSTASPTPVPPSSRLALQVLTKVWRNCDYQLSDKLAFETIRMTTSLVQNVRTAGSVEATQAVLQKWASLVVVKLGPLYPTQTFEVIQVVLQLVANATESFRRHPDFEDGFVYTRAVASTMGDNTIIATSRSAMTQSLQQQQQQQQSQHNILQVHTKPLIPGAILGKASLALDLLHRVMNNDSAALALVQDRPSVGLLTETLSDVATLAASCEGNILRLVDFVQSLGGDLGQELQSKPPKTSFIRRLEHDVDDDWEAVVDHATLGEALWLSLSVILQVIESVGHLSPPEEESKAEIFAPSLSVLQHYLKRFPGCDGVVRLVLEGYEKLARLCFPSVDMQKALLTSLCKLSLPAWGKHDTAAMLEDHHVESLLCLIGIMHNYHAHIASDWEIVLITLEELSTMSVASPMLTDGAYHSALTITTFYSRIAAFSTCFSDSAVLQLVEALCQVIRTCLNNTDFLLDSNKGAHGLLIDSTASERHSESISRQIINIGVRAIYGSSSSTPDEKLSQSAVSPRTRNRFYEEYRRNFIDRVSKSKNTIRLDSIGRVPFALALLADVALANTFRDQDCGEKISGSLSSLAASSAPVRPFLMDTIAILTMAQISSGEGSPAPFVGPGRIVFQNPMQSQLLAVEHVAGKDQGSGTANKKGIIPQTDVLGPLCDSLYSARQPDVAESALETLYSVLETVDHNLSGEVWSMVINSLATLSGDKSHEFDRSGSAWSKCCLEAFRCLKFIVNDFIDELQEESAARISLLDCCSSFGSSTQDVNTSLTAIGMLWTIADQDTGTDSIDRALSKLVLLSSDSRPEVRNASVNTLFSCIVGRGAGFSADRWESCVQDTIFNVYEVVASKARGDDESDSNPAISDSKPSRYKLSLHHSRDSESKQWIATQVVVLRGLIRVLRTFFPKLLDTTDVKAVQPEKAKRDDVPWFQDAWVQILDYAYEGANQAGQGRDTLLIRSAGVELLALCCQISSEGGMQSASPANIGTNMEVVDGALRMVRETKASTFGKHKRSHSVVCETARKNFFLEAFESLESYVGVVSGVPREDIDDVQLQVLHKFATGLTALYDCSKDRELRTSRTTILEFLYSGFDKDKDSMNPDKANDPKELDRGMDLKEGDLDGRFAKMIVDIVNLSTVDQSARYLNQTQRSCLQLLKAMGRAGSCNALRELVKLGDVFFFIKKETDGSEPGPKEIKQSESVGLEAVSAVAEAMNEATLVAECKALVLKEVLTIFQREASDGVLANRQNYRLKVDYKRLIPVIASGAGGCAVVEEALQSDIDGMASSRRALIESTWSLLINVLSIMVTPIPMGKGMVKVSRVLELSELVSMIIPKAPATFASPLCETLVRGARNCLEVAELHERCSIKHTDTEVASKSKRHRDELIQLFANCFEGSCKLQPGNQDLQTMARKTVEGAVHVMFSSKEDGESYIIDATLTICQNVRDIEGAEDLLPCLFPSLCKLISSKDEKVRTAVAETLGSEKTGHLLRTAQARVDKAEEVAKAAKDQVNLLSKELKELKVKNDRLTRDLAVLEASTTL
ncbi:hypothetical protein ACA910_010812 [Epithemia clementina (nom. ined.)]